MCRCVPGYAAVLLLLGALDGVSSNDAGEPGVLVKGIVQIEGEPPSRQEWKLDEAMQRATGEKVYVDETWLVDKKKGLANCVVTLKSKDPANRIAPKSLEKTALDKVGVRYVPRILVVTPGTEVVFRNKESPCRGFQATSSRRSDHNFNYLIREGTEQVVTFRAPDTCPITCPVRLYARGYILVVDTPFFAVTNPTGEFAIRSVPEGEYQVTVWHEAVGKLNKDAGPMEVTITAKGGALLQYRVKAPDTKVK